MADKEATVYIVSLGQSMGNCNGGRTESDLDWSMRYVWDKITTTLAANRKTWTVGVLGLGTDETDNDQDREGLDGYERISVLQEIGPMTMTSLTELQRKIQVSDAAEGDAISAIIIAVRMIEKFTKKLKYNRKVVLVTDGHSPIDGDLLEKVSDKMNQEGIALTVIGVDFDDNEYGCKEEDKPTLKRSNEALLKKLCDQCNNGTFGTMAEAIESTEVPRIKPVRPYKSYDGLLTLGDPDTYPSAASFQIERYTKTKAAIAISASTVVVKQGHGLGSPEAAEDEDVKMGGTEFGDVSHQRRYTVSDPAEPGGKRDVDFSELSKGYEYGRTVVHISESDWNVTKLETKKSFSILGFIPFSSFPSFMSMGEATLIVAQKANGEAEIALSSLINALYELESYAVARLVVKDGNQPQLVLLMPSPKLDADFECLYDLPLPFAEDVRSYQFPPLDKVLTIGGTVLKKHRLLPTEELNEAMSNYVDAMDLSTAADGEEYAPIDENYNPMIHRLSQAIRQRAVHPDEDIEKPAKILLRYSRPPDALADQAKSQIDALIKTAEVKKVPKKAHGGKFGKRDAIKPRSGLDLDALLGGQPKKARISDDNAIPDFKNMLRDAKEDSVFEDATKQMGAIIRQNIQKSYGYHLYGQAQEKLRVMREELIKYDEPDVYNEFVRALKKSLLSGELNGDRRDMWIEYVRAGRLGLITEQESEISQVTTQEAASFWK